ncbi:HupE/UreJ family protein [Thiolapillus sp.]
MNSKQLLIVAALLGMLPGMASAHIGPGSHNLMAGFIHPFTGLDHLLMALAFGLWIAIRTRCSLKQGLGLFLLPLLFGMLLGANGVQGVWVEALLAGSVIAALLMLAPGMKAGQPVGMVLFGLFALPHGLAHGNEVIALSPEGTLAAIAVALGTGIICCAGYLCGIGIVAQRKLRRN